MAINYELMQKNVNKATNAGDIFEVFCEEGTGIKKDLLYTISMAISRAYELGKNDAKSEL